MSSPITMPPAASAAPAARPHRPPGDSKLVDAPPSPDFLAALSHELRNPLSGIMTALALAEAMPVEPPVGRALRVIQRQAHELLLLAEQLTDLSQLESGQLQIAREKVDLADTLAQAHAEVAPLLNARSQQLDDRLAAGPVWVMGDGHRLTRIVTGLLSEVARHAQAQAVIELSLDTQGDRVKLVVADREAGNDRHELDNAPMVSAQHGRGRRLATNLAVVTRLVHLHGGWIDAATLDDRAPRAFTVRLPLAKPSGTRDHAGTATAAESR